MGSKSPLDPFNKRNKRFPLDPWCSAFFPQFWVMFGVLLSCYQNTSWDRKSSTQKWVQTTRKSDSQALPSLCLSVYEHIVLFHIIFGTNLGKHHSSKRYFLSLYNYRLIINSYHQRWNWPSASEWGAKWQQISVFRHKQIFRVLVGFRGGVVEWPSIPSARHTAEPGWGGQRTGPSRGFFSSRLWERGSPGSWSRARETDTAGSEEEENQAATNDAHASSNNFLLLDSYNLYLVFPA